MPKPKPSFVKPSKKGKATALPESPDEFQALADGEESRGGKWRLGNVVKSARAFERAIGFYDRGLQQHPNNFDLAYNKARLQLEVSQQPALLPHWGLSHGDFLSETLQSHQLALRINDDDADLLFNTAQVMTSLAEELSENGLEAQAIPLLHQALEILSSCLAKQEMLLEEQAAGFDDPDEESGGVSLDPEGLPLQRSEAEESVVVIQPISSADLLDTTHAALSALTTLAGLEEEAALKNLHELAVTLYDTKATAYLALLPQETQPNARYAVSLDRATFVAALTNARYAAYQLEMQALLDSLNTFDIPNKSEHADALLAEAHARSEAVLSILEQTADQELPAAICWKQLAIAQDLLAQAAKLNDNDAKETKAEVYKRKGDLELLRMRIASIDSSQVSQAIRNSRMTLLKNSQTFYKGAIAHASKPDSADEAALEAATQRLQIVEALMQIETGQTPAQANMDAWIELVDEGLMDASLLEKLSAMAI